MWLVHLLKGNEEIKILLEIVGVDPPPPHTHTQKGLEIPGEWGPKGQKC